MRAAVVAVALAATACSGGAHVTATGRSSNASVPPTATAHARPVASSTAGATSLRASTVMHLPVGLSRTVAVAAGGSLLALGGLAAGDTTTARIWRIDPVAGRARQVGALGERAHDASGAFLAGRALVFGGGSATTLRVVQGWDGTRSATVGQLPQPRSDSASAVIGSTAYVVGGFSGTSMTRDVLATTDGRSFRVVARLAIGVRYPAVAALGGALYVVGGELATTEGTLAGGQTDAVQRIDPATGRVRVVGHLGQGLGHASAFVLGGRLYVAGGRHRAAATAVIDEVDVGTGHVRVAGRLPQALSDAGVVVIGATAWLVGGETSGPAAPSSGVVAVRAT